MGKGKVLLLLKPFNVYPVGFTSRTTNPQVLKFLDNRRKVHKDAINFCKDILWKKSIDWESVLRTNLSQKIRGFDLVVTVGGDGTLLQASHFMDDSLPVLGVNSDPTRVEEVEEFGSEFDASRSTGYLCAATVANFERVLDDILEDRKVPKELKRISMSVNEKLLSTVALNDILVAHPCPAAVSRFSFKIKTAEELSLPLVNCRSSGLRVSTPAGSTAAMLSAGGLSMPIFSNDLQYMVREPISPGDMASSMHGIIKANTIMKVTWFSEEGVIHIDGSHIRQPIRYGDTIDLSSNAPVLKVFLPCHFLS